MKKNELPDKPSELLKLAMKDLELVEQNPKYKLDMGIWHEKKKSGACAMCFAGAVMNRELGCNEQEHMVEPEDFDKPTTKKLWALNNFREGYLQTALQHFGIDIETTNLPENYTDYYTEPSMDVMSDSGKVQRRDWKLHMATIIGILESEGL